LGFGLVGAVGLALLAVFWPTLASYADKYVRAARGSGASFAAWDFTTVFLRYLPL
jgi:hypothetical protein